MALALAWSRSLADAHEAGLEGSIATGESRSQLTPFVLVEDDDYTSLFEEADSPGSGYPHSAPSSAPSSPTRTLSDTHTASSSSSRPVWTEAELDKHLNRIKVQLLDQQDAKASKISLQGTALWQAPRAARLVESMQQATEALVWGERHDASLFDLFCEHRMLAAFVTALRAVIPVQVKVQILQTLSILVQNARRTTSFFFLLSGGQLNILFDDPPDLDEEEILTYFVTFLKSLALRLDVGSARLCLAAAAVSADAAAEGKPLQRLPIFECAVKLIGHRDSMVQTAARTALLSLLRLEDPLVQGAASAAALQKLAPCLAKIINAAHDAVQLPEKDSSRLQDAIEDLEDWLGFVGDLITLGSPGVSDALRRHGFTLDSRGCAVLSDDSDEGSSTSRAEPCRGDTGIDISAPSSIPAAQASSRLEVVLKHYNKKDKLPFPSSLCCGENVAVALTSIATPLVAQREVRRAIVTAILVTFEAEELCIDLDAKAGAESLPDLERRLAAALHASPRNSSAINVLRYVTRAWHEIFKQASASSPTRHADSALMSEEGSEEFANSDRKDISSALMKGRGKRYHIYTYTLIGEAPYEKLATENLKKAQSSLHYNTLMGRIAIMYDQQTGRSTFKKEKRGDTYILKAIHMAHKDYPCSQEEGNKNF